MQGKIAFVTGASSGIVLATSKLLTSINPTVALVAHSTDKLDSFAAEVFAHYWMKNILGKRRRVDEFRKIIFASCSGASDLRTRKHLVQQRK